MIKMKYCNACPYPMKCDARNRCQAGLVSQDAPVVATPVVKEEKAVKPKAVKKKVSK